VDTTSVHPSVRDLVLANKPFDKFFTKFGMGVL
jgi:hypothetical protein